MQPYMRRRITRGVALLLCIGIFFSVKPAYRAVKAWRAGQLVAEAEALFVLEEPSEDPFNKLHAAFTLSPSSPRVLAAMARHSWEAKHIANALGSWQALQEKGKLKGQARLTYAEALLTLGQNAQALALLQAAENSSKTTLHFAQLMARYYLQMGNAPSALQAAKAAIKTWPKDTTLQLYLAQAYLGLPGQAAATQALNLIHTLLLTLKTETATAKEKTATQLTLLEMQTIEKRFPGNVRLSAAQELLQHAGASMLQKLTAAEVLLTTAKEPETIVTKLVQPILEGKQPTLHTQQHVLVQWLILNGDTTQAQKVLDAPGNKNSPIAFPLQLDIWAKQGNWAAIKQALEAPMVPLPPFLQHLYYYRAANATGNAEAASRAWSRALQAATQPGNLAYLAQYTRSTGNHSAALKVYQTLAENPETLLMGISGQLHLLRQQDDLSGIITMLQTYAQAWPGQLAIGNDAWYYRMLKGPITPALTQAVEANFRKHPSNMASRINLALLHLKLGNKPMAQAALNIQNMNWEALPAHWQNIYHAVHKNSAHFEIESMRNANNTEGLLQAEINLKHL